MNLSHKYIWYGIYGALGLLAGLLEYLNGDGNNYLIFHHSFGHLLQGTDLYIHYPAEQNDLFKYSPTFALLMGALAWLPIWLGMPLFGLLCGLLLCYALRALPLSAMQQRLLLLLLLPDAMVDWQNNQTNGLLLACMLLAFIALLQRRYLVFALATGMGFVVKLYGLAIGAVALLSRRWWLYGAATMAVLALLALLPVVITGPSELAWQYENWVRLLRWDDSAHQGISVMGIMGTWWGYAGSNQPVQLAGLVIVLLPLVRIGLHRQQAFTLRFLASLLLFVVIFNHKAESPTFVIASAGVVLWYVLGPLRSPWRIGLLVFSLALTGLSPTDVFPAFIRTEWIVPYHLKALGCILIFVVLQTELWVPKKYYIDR